MTANGHSYYTGPIETVQLAQYRNLTGEGAWLFSETADVIFNTRSDVQETNPMDDGVSEFILTGELASILWVDKRSYFFSGRPDKHHFRAKRIICAYFSNRLPL